MRGSLADPLVRARRLSRLDDAHIASLSALVRGWRARWPDRVIPWFDPDDGGVGASVLLLMEAPGPRTAAAGDDGFCSEDNDDPTATVLRAERSSSGLRRQDYVKWNVVPWLPINNGGAWRAPTPGDLVEAAAPLGELIEVLRRLRLVVTVGRPALHGWTRYQSLHTEHIVPLLAVPHPSQRNAVGRVESVRRLRLALDAAARIVVDKSVF